VPRAGNQEQGKRGLAHRLGERLPVLLPIGLPVN
jgi:hypothetical protein